MVSFCVGSGYINVALGFWHGPRRLTEGITSFTHVVAIRLVLKSAAFCVLHVGGNLEAFNMAVAATSRIYRMTHRVPPIDSSSDHGGVPGHVDGTIELRNVKHIYPCRPTVTVLDNVSITFPAGKITAIVGPSGSGKSSIASLILRFYDPVAGGIFLDGSNLAFFQLQWPRQHIHVVSQEPFLFSRTIYENIEFGLTGREWDSVPKEEKRRLVFKVAEVAQGHDFITKLPLGYDTMVGARGSRLSGGQLQRVAIARALVSQPRITILDAAKIVVLRSGCMVEEGTHLDLMAARLVYFNLVKAQDMSHEDGVDVLSKRRHRTHAWMMWSPEAQTTKRTMEKMMMHHSWLARSPTPASSHRQFGL